MDIKKEKGAIKNLIELYGYEWNLTEEQKDDLDQLVHRIVAVIKEQEKTKGCHHDQN